MKNVVLTLTFLIGVGSFAQKKNKTVKLINFDQESSVDFSQGDYIISIPRTSFVMHLDELGLDSLAELAVSDTSDFMKFRMDVFSKTKNQDFTSYLIEQFYKGRVKIYSTRHEKRIYTILIKKTEEKGLGLEEYIISTMEKDRICSFGVVTSTGCPNF